MSSGKDDYREEDIVFAMVTGYPWWPGFIAEKYSKKNYKVTFFGDFSYADLGVKQIKAFQKGLKKAEQSNKELMEAVESAKRVLEGESTIEKEHKKVQESLKRARKTKVISKKKKSSRKSKRIKKATTGNAEKGKSRSKKKIRVKPKEGKLSQSMIQDPTHKRRADRMSQKKREAKLGKSMDQRMMEESGEEGRGAEGEEVLGELEGERGEKGEKKRGSSSGSKKNRKGSEKEEGEGKEEEVKQEEKERGSLKEDVKEEEKLVVKSRKQSEKIKEEKEEEVEKEKEKDKEEEKEEEKEQNESEVKSEEVKSLEKEDIVIEPQNEDELKNKFMGFEKELLSLLNEMQNNKPIPRIEENLKEWFQQISTISHFSPIVSTNIGKHLSEMTQICLERINEKQVYNKILSNIEYLKTFIIKRISSNFFNSEHLEESEARLQNEDSIITTKKNDSASKLGRGFQESGLFVSRTVSNQICLQIRLRIQKKLAKTVSRMATRNSIKKETCLTLGKRIEEFVHSESGESEEAYRELVVGLLEFMESRRKKFMEEFIFQKNRKCDVHVLRIKILGLLRSIN